MPYKKQLTNENAGASAAEEDKAGDAREQPVLAHQIPFLEGSQIFIPITRIFYCINLKKLS